MLPACLWLLPALATGQTLAEAARKEKERRKRNQEAGVETRVITEKELKSAGGTLANDPGDPPTVVAGSTPGAQEAAEGAELEDREDHEELWRKRAAQARSRVEEARQAHETLASLHLSPGDYFVDDQGKVVIRSLDHLRELIAKARAELDAAEKGLEQLEETARRSNVPAGWLR
jgi:hypothetical protein